MKQAVEKAGLRVPRHGRARSKQEAWAASSASGSRRSSSRSTAPAARTPTAATTRTSSSARCSARAHIEELSVEEFIEGEELTYDTVCADGPHPVRERRLVPARSR
jgi:hypothetical protein